MLVQVVPPVSKTLACGDVGIGAMADPSTIADAVLVRAARKSVFGGKWDVLKERWSMDRRSVHVQSNVHGALHGTAYQGRGICIVSMHHTRLRAQLLLEFVDLHHVFHELLVRLVLDFLYKFLHGLHFVFSRKVAVYPWLV